MSTKNEVDTKILNSDHPIKMTSPDGYLDIAKERLEAAPGFDSDHWPSMSDEKWNRDVYKYYGRSPYWEERV